MKIREIISIGLNLNKYYPSHDSEQHLRGFNCQSDTFGSANIDSGTITFESYNLKSM